MKPAFLLYLAFTITISGASLVQAETAIRDLQRNASRFTIAGTVRGVVGNQFILDDGTGQLIVDAGPSWHDQLNLVEGEQVTVVGEYDDYDFDAHRITRANGEVILVRAPAGPPSWTERWD